MNLLPAILLFGMLASAQAEPTPPKNDPLRKIAHIVVIYAENRSFDNLYGLFPGADGIGQASAQSRTQTDHDGRPLPHLPPVWNDRRKVFGQQPIPNGPFRIDGPPFNLGLDARTPDLVHRYYQHIEQIDGGRLDRYAAMSDAGALTMGYYDGAQLPLWQYARAFVLADHFFMGAFGGSFLNHFWLICACTPYFADAPETLKAQLDDRGRLKRHPTSPSSALEGPPRVRDGALTPDGYAVNTLQPPYQPSGVAPAVDGDLHFADPAHHPLPPQTQRTIGDALSAKGIRWAWYAEAWDAALVDGMRPPGAARSVIYGHQPDQPSLEAHHQPFNYFARFAPGTAERREHLRDGSEFLAAIDAGTLPSVAFYKPGSHHNEHSGYAEIIDGDRHIAEIVERLKASPLWPTMAIIVTYDENGGYWDHVPPSSGPGWGDRWGPGARIPALIISPFAKRGYVDPTPYDTTSILKFITRRFDLEPLPGVRRNVGDLGNAFAFPSE